MITVVPEQEPVPEVAPEDTTRLPQEQSTVPDQTTLVPNEAEAFALEPLDVTSLGKDSSILIHAPKRRCLVFLSSCE